MKLNKEIEKIILNALEEDIGKGDITTFFTVSVFKNILAHIIAKEKGVLCGVQIAREVFKKIDPQLRFKAYRKDGELIEKKEKIAHIKGKAVNILKAERVALNFLSHLSGIATSTRSFVDKVKGSRVKIMDTRKTTPTLRILEKYAVRVGGGFNHRQDLWKEILIKDNHLKASGVLKKGKIDQKVLAPLMRIIKKVSHRKIEIEVENISQFKKVIVYRPHIIMLDNFSLKDLKKAVVFRNKYYPEVKLEASGRVNLGNVKEIATRGVEYISVGSITHSSASLDFSLEIRNS